MGIIKAVRNLVLGESSNAIYNHDVKSAKAKAYSETGRKLKLAKKRGYKIDGSATYKKILSGKIEKAKQKKDIRDKFISDL